VLVDGQACPTAAVNWQLEYFLEEDLHKKNIVNLLWAGRNAHLQWLARAPVAGNGCFLLANYNDWPRW